MMGKKDACNQRGSKTKNNNGFYYPNKIISYSFSHDIQLSIDVEVIIGSVGRISDIC